MIHNLQLSAAEVADALGVCMTAASRKIAATEHIISIILAFHAGQLARSKRPDRITAAAASRLRTLAAIVAKYPAVLEPWIGAILSEFSPRPRMYEPNSRM